MKAKTVLVFVGGITVGVTGTVYMSRNALREAFIKWSVEKMTDALYAPVENPIEPDISKFIRKSDDSTTREVIDFVVDTRKEAEVILEDLREVIDHYGNVSIAEYYDYIGYSPTTNDLMFGWTDLNGAYTQPTRRGFRVKFPPSIKLNDDKKEVEDNEKSN